MFKYYFDRGMKISNLQFCVEYTKDAPMASFVETMTEHRKQATRDGNDELQMMYKVGLQHVTQIKYFNTYFSLLSIGRVAFG